MDSIDPDEQFYRDTESIAFPKLSDAQLALLEPLGTKRILYGGEPVFSSGQRDLAMMVVLSGEIEVFACCDGSEMILASHGPRDFVGDVAMLNGTSAISSARGKAPESLVLEIPADKLRRALAELPGVGERLTQAFIIRRQRLQRDPDFTGLRVVSERNCRRGQHMHDFLDKNHIPHRFIAFDSVEGHAACARFDIKPEDLPVLIDTNGNLLKRPSLRDLAEIAGLLRPLVQDESREVYCDLAIVGAGPAGLSAAVNAASEGLRTVVLEAYAPGGQAASSSLIENFFGFPTGISGGDLTNRAQLQAFRFGAKFSTPSQALTMELFDEKYRAALHMHGTDSILRAKSVIIATGADYRRIEAEGRERFEGLGVYYAATAMEAKLCRDATVIVAGGGNSAGQAAMFLSEYAKKVLLVVRGSDFSKSMSNYLSCRVEAAANIEIVNNTRISRMLGSKRLESVELENMVTHERRVVQSPSVFSMIGANPCTHWLPDAIARDEKGFIKTGQSISSLNVWSGLGREPSPLETSCPGIFAAGDVRSLSVKRCSAAVGEGGMAVEEVHRFLKTYA